MRQIEVLTLAGRPDQAVEFLEGVEFAYREGSSRVRDIIIDAQIMLGKKYLKENNYEKALDYFLEARVPEEEAGSARSGNRDIQVNYYIGLTHEALGNGSEANAFFKLSVRQQPGRTADIMTYYKGLSYTKLGEVQKAKNVFESMIGYADQQLQGEHAYEAGVIFGEREIENTRISRYYTIRGLGYKGSGHAGRAAEDLEQAMKLSHSNLWAKTALMDY
jgi:tetratricopeptide (TPR) repeat protein